MRITIFGANGPTGRLLTERALAAGHHVVAATRRPATFPVGHRRLAVAHVDVHDQRAVDHAVARADAVLSTLGVPYSRQPITTYSAGTDAIIGAMSEHGVKRLAVVSSSATVPTTHADGGFLLNRVMQPLITRTIGKTLYADMRRMEATVAVSTFDWTILRPGGLFHASSVTDYEMREERSERVFTSYVDLAAALLAQVEDTTWRQRIAAINTIEGAPTIGQMIRANAGQRSGHAKRRAA